MTSALPAGVVEFGGRQCMIDARGAYLPLELVKEKDKLEDSTVRSIAAAAHALSAAITDFKTKAFADVDAYVQLLEEQYKVTKRGVKGNMTLQTFDGLTKILIQVADRLVFGEEIQMAKALVDECLAEWSAQSRPELQAIVQNAFRTDKEGQLNRYAILSLRKLEITDERWIRAMKAITDSQSIESSARYIRVYTRATTQGSWRNVSLDVATA